MCTHTYSLAQKSLTISKNTRKLFYYLSTVLLKQFSNSAKNSKYLKNIIKIKYSIPTSYSKFVKFLKYTYWPSG